MTTWARTGASQPPQAPGQAAPLAAPAQRASATLTEPQADAPQPAAAPGQPPASLNITITKPPTGLWEIYNIARSVSWMVLFVLIFGTIVSKCA